jgi:hypothetical protein
MTTQDIKAQYIRAKDLRELDIRAWTFADILFQSPNNRRIKKNENGREKYEIV